MRAAIVLVGSVLCASTLSGCFTQKLWSESRFPARETYTERVSSVLVSQDGKTLVIIGEDYHYLFDAPQVILKTLSSDYQKFVVAGFGLFSVDTSQSIKGAYFLDIAPGATEAAKISAKRAGFVENAEGRLRIEGILSGTRYSAGTVKIQTTSHQLMREYSVSVNAPVSSDDRRHKILLTPLAVLADGAIVLGAVALIAVGAGGGLGIGVPSGGFIPR